MIDDTTTVFPNNVVNICKTRFEALDADLEVFRRPLRASDPVQCVGVFGVVWQTQEESYEMRGGPTGWSEPSLQRYQITVQAMVRDMDEERGLAVHSVLSKLVRAVLYRDEPLRVGLSSLSTTVSGTTERTQRWGLGLQRFLSNEVQGSWIYLSTLDFWLETETV